MNVSFLIKIHPVDHHDYMYELSLLRDPQYLNGKYHIVLKMSQNMKYVMIVNTYMYMYTKRRTHVTQNTCFKFKVNNI